MNKCKGCGITTELDLCERCFRIKHYNEYQVINKNNKEFVEILNQINETNDLVVFVVDVWNIPDLKEIKLNNPILLVLTKRDLLPYKMNNEKILNYDYKINCVDKIIISSENNYQFDLLLEKVKQYKTSDNIYVVGYTNAGKSTMINKLLYNYSQIINEITTSPLPSTTLDKIEIKFKNMTIIDTPGLLNDGDIANYVTGEQLKKILPKKEINPITYQIKSKQYIKIDEFAIIEASDINLTFYMSNQLNIKRYYKEINNNFKKNIIAVNKNDLVIRGLGFIKTNKKSVINVYTLDKVDVFTRDSLI